MKDVAVAVEFAEKVAIARTKFKRSELSQMDLDWHEARWKTFPQSNDINALLDELTNETTSYWDIAKKLRSTKDKFQLFSERAVVNRKINNIRHKLFLVIAKFFEEKSQ